MLLGDGDGFVRCACGHWHWGVNGAAGLLAFDPDRGVLLQRRAWWTHHGRTWALPGGAVRSDETPGQAARREAAEEADVPAGALRSVAASTEEHGTWRYTTVLAKTRESFEARAVSSESADLRWVAADRVDQLPLHRDFAAAWPALAEQLDRELVLIVDGANVLGSRPDGWWRDRADAAARLRDQLEALVATAVPAGDFGLPGAPKWTWWPRVRLVVEGPAAGTESGPEVDVVSAVDDGDAAVVANARQAGADNPRNHVTVVTADRALRARVAAEGADTVGPATLLRLLDAARSGEHHEGCRSGH